jgi:colanic acid biosynthesis protein WcaH
MFLPPDVLIEVIHYTPLVSIDLVVRDQEERVLVGWRSNRPAQNCWFVPGGRICKDERIAEAFRRISKNELGLTLEQRDARFLGVYEHLYEDNFAGRAGFGTHYIVLGYEIHLSAPLPSLPDEQHEQYRWFSVPDLLAEPDVHPNTKAYFLPR